MKADLLERLLDAGFTKTEILQLARDEPTPDPEPNPTPAPDPEPNPTPTPDPNPTPEPNPTPDPNPTPAPAPDTSGIDQRLTGIEKTISDLVKTIQASNLKNDSFGNNPDSLETQTDKIMASIIRPEKAGKEDAK